jgi:hypothetical protein
MTILRCWLPIARRASQGRGGPRGQLPRADANAGSCEEHQGGELALGGHIQKPVVRATLGSKGRVVQDRARPVMPSAVCPPPP